MDMSTDRADITITDGRIVGCDDRRDKGCHPAALVAFEGLPPRRQAVSPYNGTLRRRLQRR